MKFALIFAVSGVLVFIGLIVWLETILIPGPHPLLWLPAFAYIGLQFFLILLAILFFVQAFRRCGRNKPN